MEDCLAKVRVHDRWLLATSSRESGKVYENHHEPVDPISLEKSAKSCVFRDCRASNGTSRSGFDVLTGKLGNLSLGGELVDSASSVAIRWFNP
jgi:hypothetical protein